MEDYPLYWPQFYTATILEWKPLLKPDKYKEIIVSSLQRLTSDKKITLYAFVIMSNHIHLIWQALAGNTPEKICPGGVFTASTKNNNATSVKPRR